MPRKVPRERWRDRGRETEGRREREVERKRKGEREMERERGRKTARGRDGEEGEWKRVYIKSLQSLAIHFLSYISGII